MRFQFVCQEPKSIFSAKKLYQNNSQNEKEIFKYYRQLPEKKTAQSKS
jgi:hypothetical protein